MVLVDLSLFPDQMVDLFLFPEPDKTPLPNSEKTPRAITYVQMGV